MTKPSWRDWLSVSADFIQVTTFFGLTITGLIAALVMAIGYLNDVPWYWVAVGTPFAGLCTFVMLNWKSGIARYEHDSVPAKNKEFNSAGPEKTPNKTPIPDWTIRELFFHIRPSLQIGADTNYESVSLVIRDKLSTGQLKIWGRRITFLGDTRPFDEIDSTYWQRADFNYSFLLGDVSAPHTTVDQHSGLAEYHELHVNQAQALAIWPEALLDPAHIAEAQFSSALNRAIYQRNRVTKESALFRLTQLRSEGVALRNESAGLMFTSHLGDWSSKVGEWMNEVIETIKPVSHADAEWFVTLGEVPSARVPIPNLRLGGEADRTIFVKMFREHDFRLKRLGDLLLKHGVGA